MKIVYMNGTCGSGSTGRLTVELARQMSKKGHDCKVYYSHGQPLFSPSDQIGNLLDHRVHALMSRVTGLQGYFSLSATKSFIKELETLQPDVVHLHILHSNYIHLKTLFDYLRQNHIPTVITLHDCWFYTGKCTYYVPADCDKWQHECGKCPLLHKDNINPTYFFDTTRKCLSDKKKMYAGMDKLAVVGVSNWVMSEAQKSVLNKAKMCCIYNWVDQDVFYKRDNVEHLRDTYHLQDKFVLLMVSSKINHIKGYDVMRELAQRLDDRYQIIIIGKNDYQLEIPDNVIHIQHTNNTNELAQFYSLADICINTTLYETFGMVTAEAMSCGTPVIVWNNTASIELVADGCGIVVDAATGINGVVNAIESIRNWDLTNTSEKCIAWAKSKFNKECNTLLYEELYKSLIE